MEAEWGKPLPVPHGYDVNQEAPGSFFDILRAPHPRRTLMLVIFNFFQTIGYYGFASWVPTLIISRGITTTASLRYSFIIAMASPFAPLLGITFADKIERKWQIRQRGEYCVVWCAIR